MPIKKQKICSVVVNFYFKIILMNYLKVSILVVSCFSSVALMAQKQVADKVIAQVGNKIILQSELNEIYNQEKANDASITEASRCSFLKTLISQQILVEQAGRDSVIVSDEEVEENLDNRIRNWMGMYGSREAFEEANGGRTMYQIKDDFRAFFKDRAVANKMQGQLMSSVKVTPQEVQRFFDNTPKDSLPMYPATVEVGQIVIKPKVDAEIEQLIREKLEGIRKEIVENGKSFATMAGIYGQDGTKNTGGELDIKRKEVDPAFASAAFRLQPGETSPVFKSKFGYHIVQMIRRMGDEARVRHIILIPEVTTSDLQVGLKKLDSVRADLISGKISFPVAVGKYSTDDQSKMTGGMVMDQNGNTTLRIDDLDADMAKAATELKIGEYSQPQIFSENAETGSRATRILYLKSRTEPHILNMKDDYAHIQQAALANKQNKTLDKWITENASAYFIKIDSDFDHCEEIKSWNSELAKEK